MIQSFACKETKKVFEGDVSRKLPGNLLGVTSRKLTMVHLAERLDDLRVPPGNQLEALKGTRRGQHSIRINQQWRICFRWTTEGPAEVEIIDYHR
ncbi:MAG: type II toxin-antitoxin system RelE/ParE family toxin [Verrucomicrobiae bacterium]